MPQYTRRVHRFKVYDAPPHVLEGLTERLGDPSIRYEDIVSWTEAQGYKLGVTAIRNYHHWLLDEEKSTKQFGLMVDKFAEYSGDRKVEDSIVDFGMHLVQVAMLNVENVSLGGRLTVDEIDKVIRLSLRVSKVRADIAGMKKRLGIEIGNVNDRIQALGRDGNLDAIVLDRMAEAILGIPNRIGMQSEIAEDDDDL